MNYPTPEEIRLAHDAINADGLGAETTIRLTAMVLHDPILRAIADRMDPEGFEPRMEFRNSLNKALIVSAIVTGLNYGLRIHEQRMATEAWHRGDDLAPPEKAGGAS